MRAFIRWEVTTECTGGFRSRTLEELVAFWKAWSDYDRPMEHAVTWADVKASIVVKEVAALATKDPWKMYEASLMPMECDSGVHRSFFRTFQFDSCGSKQFGLPLMESDWYDLVSGLIEIAPADEMRCMGRGKRLPRLAGSRRMAWEDGADGILGDSVST